MRPRSIRAFRSFLLCVEKAEVGDRFISPFVTVLYQVSTDPEDPQEFRLLCNMRTHSMHVPRYIDPRRNLVVSSHACMVELLHWTNPNASAVELHTEGETLEEMVGTSSTNYA